MLQLVPSPLLAQCQQGVHHNHSPLSFPSHRPLKVERGRKKSDPIPERRMEKKKGERATASHHRGEKREGRAPGLVAPSLGQGGISGVVPGSFPALL